MKRSWLAVVAAVTIVAFAACGGQAAQEEAPMTEEAAPPVEEAPAPVDIMEQETEAEEIEPEPEEEEETETPPTES